MESQLPETGSEADSTAETETGTAAETETGTAAETETGTAAETEPAAEAPAESEPADGSVTDEAAAANPGACPVVESLERIGSRWRLIVLHELLDGERRFNDLKRATGANARTLSRVLDDLGEMGFVNRRLEEDAPVATYYSLTAKGESLEGVFEEIECWAGSWLDEDGDGEAA